MNLYVQKPCEAIQFTKENIQDIMTFLPEERFVFFGISMINGKEQKVFEDNLSSFSKIGGFLYYNRETKVILENDWILKRKNHYEVMANDYFIDNFIQIPFLKIEDVKIEDVKIDTNSLEPVTV